MTASSERGEDQVLEAADMEQRTRRHRDGAGRETERRLLRDRSADRAGMCPHGALWVAGGPRGVHDHCPVVTPGGVEPRLRPRCLVDQLRSEQPRRRRRIVVTHPKVSAHAEAAAQRRERRGQPVVDSKHRAPRVFDRVGELVSGQPPVQPHRDRADPGDAEVQPDILQRVVHHQADPVARPDAKLQQRVRRAVGVRLQLAVAPRRLVLERQGRVVGPHAERLCRASQQLSGVHYSASFGVIPWCSIPTRRLQPRCGGSVPTVVISSRAKPAGG